MVEVRPIRSFKHHLMFSLALLSLGPLLSACGGAAGPEALLALDASGHALSSTTVPWPSEAFVDASGHVSVEFPLPFDSSNTQNLIQLAATLSELDGFGTTTSIFFPVSADVVVDDGATATVVDLADPTKTFAYPLYYRADTKQLVAFAPVGTALKEHHRYGCYLASGVHDAHGHPLRPSVAMQFAMAGDGVVGGQPAHQALAQLLQKGRVHPLAATAFTTQTLNASSAKVLADLSAMPPSAHVTRLFRGKDLDDLFGGPSTSTRPGRPPSGGVVHDAVALAVEGTYDTPHYLSETPGTLGLFTRDAQVRAVDHVPFLLVLPKRPSYHNTPIIIFQHGINSDRVGVLLVCNDFAARGYAVLGIDELWHGSRLPGNVDLVNNLSGAPIPDGIGDPSTAGAIQYFFNFNGDPAHGVQGLDPRYMRDSFRQATVDLMQEVRLAKQGDFADVVAKTGLADLTIDGSHLVYTGESFGSMLGAQLLAVDPLLDAAALAVGGGGFVLDLLSNSAQFALLLQPLVAGAFDLALDIGHPDVLPVRAQMSLTMLQTINEPGDALALAAIADPKKVLLLLEAYGDETVPNPATEALAGGWAASQVTLSMRSLPTKILTLPTVSAPYAGMPLHALVQMDPASHGMFTDQHGQRNTVPGGPPFVKQLPPIPIDNPIEIVHALAADFADTFRASGAPTVTDPTKP